jgi:hypothetical protein
LHLLNHPQIQHFERLFSFPVIANSCLHHFLYICLVAINIIFFFRFISL